MLGSIVWRGPFEAIIILCIALAAGVKISSANLKWWFCAGFAMALLEIMDDSWLMVFGLLGEQTFGYTPKPQHGIMASCLVAIVVLGLSKKNKPMWWLLLCSTAYLLFVHVVFLSWVSTELEERDLARMKVEITSPFFKGVCTRQDVACYEGPWREDAQYEIHTQHPISSFAVSTLKSSETPLVIDANNPELSARIGGIDSINQVAVGAGILTHAWATGWTDRRNIDQPEKYAAYYKNGDQVRIMINYRDPVYSRAVVTKGMRALLGLFALVWIILGVFLIEFHRSIRSKD